MADSPSAGIISAGFSASTGLHIQSPFAAQQVPEPEQAPKPEQLVLESLTHHGRIDQAFKWAGNIVSGGFSAVGADRSQGHEPFVAGATAETAGLGASSTTGTPSIIKLNMKDLFSMTSMMYTPPVEEKDERSISVRIHMLKKNRYVTLDVGTSSTIAELRRQAASQLDLSHRRLMLIFNGSQLEDHEEIKSLGMSHGCTIFCMECISGGQMGIFQLDPSDLDPGYDFDFTNRSSDGKTYWRGGHKYRRPYGWKRYAVKVHGEYDNDTWLGENGIRTESSPGEWAVSYHGTAERHVKPILEDGYKIGHRKLFGPAVYTSPNLEKIDEYGYTKEFTKDGKRYKFALQNRVNPNHLTVIKPDETGYADFPYWLSPMQDPKRGIFHVRPYGILTREL